MTDISHFMIPADNVERARHFYTDLLGWKIESLPPAGDSMGIGAMQYHDIKTGAARPGALNSGGLYKRQMNEPVLAFVEVEDLDLILAKVERLGGKITLPKSEIPGVGQTAMILDSEGNSVGLWTPIKK